MTETRIREEICRLGRSLFERGLTPGSSGNISVRLDDGGWMVTPTNASLGSLDPARLSRLDADAGVFLARIQAGAASMQSLLADVVDYWAAIDGDGQSSKTNMEAALTQALLFAEKQIAEALQAP